MNMTKLNNVMKNLVFPLMVGGILWSGEARANAAGDITSIKSDQANGTYTASGTTIDFKMTLAGYFKLDNSLGGTVALPPDIRMVVNGDVAYAQLYSLSQYTIAAGTVQRTDAIFRYTVKPGDMAQPLKIFGSTSVAYQFNWNSWQIISATNSAVQPVWKFNVPLSLPSEGEVYDIDLTSVAKITVRTLSFDDLHSPVSIAATENNTWRVDTVNPVASAVVDFYVWTTGTNILQLGNVPSQTALLVSMPTGATTVDFPVRGLAIGTTDVYLQRTKDYQNNATLGVTNYIKRSISITTPPAPTIKVTMLDTLSDNVTLPETTTLNTGSFQVELSETYSNDVTVGIATQPVGQSNVTFASTPYLVTVPAGSLISSAAKFSAADGTALSASSGVILTPYVTNNALAKAYFTRIKNGTVYVTNVKPTLLQPQATDTPTVTRGVPYVFTWQASDVAADLASGMTVNWNFNGETVTNVSGSSGSIPYMFNTTGTKTIKVTATDKDGATSDLVTFTVTVVLPQPKPGVRLVPYATGNLTTPVSEFAETTTNSTGSLVVYLTESYSYDVYVQLAATVNGHSQSNIVFASTDPITIAQGSTNSQPLKFTLRDGTLESEINGVKIVPTVIATNGSPANTYFTDLQPVTVYVDNVKPVVTVPVARDISLTPLPQYTNVAMGRPFSFVYTVKDVAADASSMVVTWDFGDGSGAVVTGAVGSVSHTYSSLGTRYVSVQALDKDGGQSDLVQFPVLVVTPPPPPTVRILSPAGALYETSAPNTGSFIVQLSEAFTNVVTVNLTTLPVNNLTNGTIVLSANQVVFGVGETEKTVRFSARDGTDLSYTYGFSIIPSVASTVAAQNYFTAIAPGTAEIINVDPVIQFPTSTYSPAVAQGSQTTFTWSISDVSQDLLDDVQAGSPKYAMTVTWYFGDGAVQTVYGGSGTISHTYTVTGDVNVRMTARDKDGGYSEVTFKITVGASKAVNVTPKGPNTSAYYGATGRGNGMVFSYTAISSQNRNNVYFFSYSPTATSATLEAVPYKTAPLGYYNVTNYNNSGAAVVDPTPILYDSFFFVWDGADQGISADNLNPAKANNSAVISLPTTSTGTGTGTSGTTTSVDIRDVSAIFSREWRIADNLGDINQDGIPDSIAIAMETKLNSGTTATTGTLPAGLTDLSNYNLDLDAAGNAVGDFWPINPNGTGGRFDFRPVSDAKGGNAFTALQELRGVDPGLNLAGVSDPDGDIDEPGTDPLLADTDGDGLPDAWEYYFWYNAQFKGLTGSAYNPLDVANGTLLDSKSIKLAFEPSKLTASRDGATLSSIAPASRDFDNDGLTDIEELTIGTNPTQWDTDGDGISDGWEVLRNMDPCDPKDGLLATQNNPDGDYMAYASVPRMFVTVVSGGTVTNTYLAPANTVVGPATNGIFTTWYNYGSPSDPLAVGRPVTLPANSFVVQPLIATNALVMHFQVFREFGFDPRTAWTGNINPTNFPNRFPTWIASAVNTKPFTSLDEYLLLKFMSETRMNGATASMAPNVTVWKSYTTDPKTPDSDATASAVDGMPDGWELYVSVDPTTDLTVAANRVMRISPWNPLDGDLDYPSPNAPPQDGLVNRREFAGTDSSAYYNNAALYNASNFVGVVSIKRPAVDANWINKFWPTNPWAPDTDGDGVNDLAERAFMYGTPVDNGTPCTQGGGLNPNSMDTDRDGLPDGWELQFTGTIPTGAGPFSGLTITNGMDGTFADAKQDWDYDGLLNYQEYWVQAVRSFRYDIPGTNFVKGPITGNAGLPIDATYDTSSLFTQITNPWDVAKYPWGPNGANLWVMLPVGPAKLYVSTDPRNPDTDGDGMDDYYEMFHGLNPILGMGILASGLDDRVGRAYIKNNQWTIDYGGYYNNEWGVDSMDFVRFPWLTGMPEADPDADGLLNLEEMLLANTSSPQNYNTDPTPLWLTDPSNPQSVVMRFYQPGNMYFWPPTLPTQYVFPFEANEGYDTDNDGVSDKDELVGTRNPNSDPQNSDDPVRRQALWFSGTNSAATTVSMSSYVATADRQAVGDIELAFRSFTIELWARPERVFGLTGQVLIERAFAYGPSDASTPSAYLSRNYRIGIAPDGRVYASFDNAGAPTHDSHTDTAIIYGPVLRTNTWVHLAARMSGTDRKLTLFVNGNVYATLDTTLIPANGIDVIRNYPTDSTFVNFVYSSGSLAMGAANNAPVPLDTLFWTWAQTWGDFDQFYRGWIDEVRIWDGARDNSSIQADYKKRYTHNDLWVNRYQVAQKVALGYTRDASNSKQLPPLLFHHYTFDNLFGADTTNSVATAPRGFNDGQVDANRPIAPGAEVPWWSASAVHSTIYSDYKYLPWIENGVDHLPLFGGLASSTVSNGTVRLLPTDKVMDSVYWSQTHAGPTNQNNSFPNSANPYGFVYKATDPHLVNGGFLMHLDLLPLGDAYAKQVAAMWDDQGPAENWLETGVDSDSDGLPDWWEAYVTGGNKTSLEWSAVNPATGMTYGEQYQRDIANGATSTNPSGVGGLKQTADSDGDGMPDWWEKLYGLNPSSAVGDDGAGGDPDRDGLSNLAEYMISEVYGFRHLSPRLFKTDSTQPVSDYFMKQGALTLGEMFSDHDFMEDSWEDLYAPYYVNRYVYDPQLDNDEDGWSNWAEARFSAFSVRMDPSRKSHLTPEGPMDPDFPVPVIEARMSYNFEELPGGPLVVQVYSSPAMNGLPDASYQVSYTVPADKLIDLPGNSWYTGRALRKALGTYTKSVYRGTLTPGSISPGSLLLNFTQVNATKVYWWYLPDGWHHGPYEEYILWAPYATDNFIQVPTGPQGRDAPNAPLATDGNIVDNNNNVVGTINYLTGEYMVDLGELSDRNPLNDYTAGYFELAYKAGLTGVFPTTLYLADADSGYVREGKNYIFAFIDLNANGTWDAGEPCGVATPFEADIGWDHNKVNIELTDYTPGYLRMSLASGLRSEDVFAGSGSAAGSGASAGGGGTTASAAPETRVRVRRSLADGYSTYQRIVLDKVIESPRNFLHEGDFMGQGDLGLDWGLTDVPTSMNRERFVYDVYVGNSDVLTNNTHLATFTNLFDVGSARAQAKATSPAGGKYVYSARPFFRWTMPHTYTAFAVEIRKGSSTGPVVYQSGEIQAPARDVVTDECVWEVPIHAGDKLPNGQVFASNTLYAWRVIALNAKFTLTTTPITWSSWNMFRLDVNAPLASSGYGAIKAVVKYYGPATNLLSGRVKVQVFNNRGFTGVPAAQYTLTDSELVSLVTPGTTDVNAFLGGLMPSSLVGDSSADSTASGSLEGNYYVRAFIDHNQNGARDVWESWGYANYYGETDTPYDVRPFRVEFSSQTPTATIIIEDADSDQDWFPDAWEYEQNPTSADFLNLTGPNAAWTAGDTGINPWLLTGTSFSNGSTSGGSPWGSPGLMSMALGTTDADGDGVGDLAELVLGMNPNSVSTAHDGYTDADKLSLGLSGADTLAFGLTGISTAVSGAKDLTWKLDVAKAASVSRSFLSAITGVASDGTVTYSIEYTPSLLNVSWQSVQTGTVKLDGTQTFEQMIDAKGVIDPAKGFFRVRLIK